MRLSGPLRRAAAVMLAVLTAAGGSAALAAPEAVATIRTGNHPGFGRIVIDTGAGAAYHVDQADDHVTVRFLSPVTLGAPPPAPRNVVAIRTGVQALEVTIKSGSTVRSGRMGDRFVIDVIGP